MKKTSLLLLLLLAIQFSWSQQKTYTGIVLDSATLKPIAYASITDLSSRKTFIANDSGKFTITMNPNHVLCIAAIGYFFDTVSMAGLRKEEQVQIFYLKQLSKTLTAVTVSTKSKYNQYQLDSMQRRKEFALEVGGDYKIPTVSQSNSGAGIALNIDRFSNYEKKKRRAFAFFEENEKHAYIDYRFGEEIVTQYTGYKNEKLWEFIQSNRPSYNWLRKHTSEEDLKYYINDKLKEGKGK